MSYCYLMFRKDRPKYFKIGISVDPSYRFDKIVGTDWLDKNKTTIIKTQSYKHLERILHKTFADYRSTPFQEDGGTEWFDVKCFKKVLSTVNKGKELLAVESVVKYSELPKTVVKAVDETLQEHLREPAENTEKCEEFLQEAKVVNKLIDEYTYNEFGWPTNLKRADRITTWVYKMVNNKLFRYTYHDDTAEHKELAVYAGNARTAKSKFTDTWCTIMHDWTTRKVYKTRSNIEYTKVGNVVIVEDPNPWASYSGKVLNSTKSAQINFRRGIPLLEVIETIGRKFWSTDIEAICMVYGVTLGGRYSTMSVFIPDNGDAIKLLGDKEFCHDYIKPLPTQLAASS